MIKNRTTAGKPRNNESELLKELKSTGIKSIGSYVLGKTIGEGTYGKVKLALHTITGQELAVKIVDKIHAPIVVREIETWKRLRHPNIAQLFEVLTSETKIYMVCEFARGGELFDYVTHRGALPEKDAKPIFRQLLEAMKYCHDKKFVHRDLKLENVLLDSELRVKLIDFGFTREYETKGKLLETYCGSTAYAAPEMIQGHKYTGPEADIWSLGVILYTLVCGYLPFDDDNESRVHSKIMSLEYEIPSTLSDDCRGLIAGVLKAEPKERMSIESMLQHRWLGEAKKSLNTRTEDPIFFSDSVKVETLESSGSDSLVVPSSFPLPNGLSSRSNSHQAIAQELRMDEKLLLHHLTHLGVDTKSMLTSIAEDACDQQSALFYLLLRKMRGSSLSDTVALLQMNMLGVKMAAVMDREAPGVGAKEDLAKRKGDAVERKDDAVERKENTAERQVPTLSAATLQSILADPNALRQVLLAALERNQAPGTFPLLSAPETAVLPSALGLSAPASPLSVRSGRGTAAEVSVSPSPVFPTPLNEATPLSTEVLQSPNRRSSTGRAQRLGSTGLGANSTSIANNVYLEQMGSDKGNKKKRHATISEEDEEEESPDGNDRDKDGTSESFGSVSPTKESPAHKESRFATPNKELFGSSRHSVTMSGKMLTRTYGNRAFRPSSQTNPSVAEMRETIRKSHEDLNGSGRAIAALVKEVPLVLDARAPLSTELPTPLESTPSASPSEEPSLRGQPEKSKPMSKPASSTSAPIPPPKEERQIASKPAPAIAATSPTATSPVKTSSIAKEASTTKESATPVLRRLYHSGAHLGLRLGGLFKPSEDEENEDDSEDFLSPPSNGDRRASRAEAFLEPIANVANMLRRKLSLDVAGGRGYGNDPSTPAPHPIIVQVTSSHDDPSLPTSERLADYEHASSSSSSSVADAWKKKMFAVASFASQK